MASRMGKGEGRWREDEGEIEWEGWRGKVVLRGRRRVVEGGRRVTRCLCPGRGKLKIRLARGRLALRRLGQVLARLVYDPRHATGKPTRNGAHLRRSIEVVYSQRGALATLDLNQRRRVYCA